MVFTKMQVFTYLGNLENLGILGFQRSLLFRGICVGCVCCIDVETSRYLAFCRCARGFHVSTVPHGVQIRCVKLAVA